MGGVDDGFRQRVSFCDLYRSVAEAIEAAWLGRRIFGRMRTRSAVAVAGLLLTGSTAAAWSQQPKIDSRSEKAIDSLFARYTSPGFPGCAVSVTYHGEKVFAAGYGLADLEHAATITPNTMFEVMSVSKQFTGMAIALLMLDGKVKVDDDIRRFLPEFPEAVPPITVADLLHHTSGLRDVGPLLALRGRGPTDRITSGEIVAVLARQRGNEALAGSAFSYDNTNYILLAVIVERVSGESLRKFTDRRIFTPLGMGHTHFLDDPTEVVPDRAIGYAPRPKGGFSISTPLYDNVGAYALLTTAEDLVKWERNFVTAEVGGLPTVSLMQAPGQLTNGKSSDYGFGLATGNYRGRKFIQHTGAGYGFRATFMRFPEEGRAVAVLCNLSSASSYDLALKVADVFATVSSTPDEMAADTSSSPRQQLTPGELAPFTGTYWNSDIKLVRRVYVDGDSLMMVSGLVPFPLVPIRQSEFVVGPNKSIHYVFGIEPLTGKKWMRREAPGTASQSYEWYQNREPTPRDFAGLTGVYGSLEAGTLWRLRIRDGQLFVGRPNGSEAAARMAMPDVFTIGPTVLEFTRQKAGMVDGFVYSANGVRGLRFRRCAIPDTLCESALFPEPQITPKLVR